MVSSSVMDALRSAAPFSLPALWEPLLEGAYASGRRAYHTLSHVAEVARSFEDVGARLGWNRPGEVYVAALFHDAIYEASRHDNEARSADLAAQALASEPGLALDVARVRELILLTAKHGQIGAQELERDARHFLDCDMAILGASDTAYTEYEEGVKFEYEQVVPWPLYRAGRGRFLESLLAADRIFLSDDFHARLDGRARENLRRALTALRAEV